ncbi:MAG TPA: carbohydate-binding domain-containing protein, partial [Duganella sp.]|nr:carbohydate-binding domain-containing protein [Duganella sp.]
MLNRKTVGDLRLASLSLLVATMLGTVAWAAEIPGSSVTKQSAPAAAPVATGAKLRLRWELERNEFTAVAPGGVTHARFVLTNLDRHPLPPQGWSLYFNCMDGVATGPLAGNLTVEQVAGGLFRIRPAPGFAGVAPGQTLNVPYIHPNLVIKLAKAPVGPYLVYDSAPGVGQNIADYELLPVQRPEQIDKGDSGAKVVVTPRDTYRRNASADLLPAEALPPVFPTPLRLQQGLGTLHLAAPPR